MSEVFKKNVLIAIATLVRIPWNQITLPYNRVSFLEALRYHGTKLAERLRTGDPRALREVRERVTALKNLMSHDCWDMPEIFLQLDVVSLFATNGKMLTELGKGRTDITAKPCEICAGMGWVKGFCAEPFMHEYLLCPFCHDLNGKQVLDNCPFCDNYRQLPPVVSRLTNWVGSSPNDSCITCGGTGVVEIIGAMMTPKQAEEVRQAITA